MVETKYSRVARGFGHVKFVGCAFGLLVVATLIAGTALGSGVTITGREEPSIVISLAASATGFAITTLLYLQYTGRGVEYIDISEPTLYTTTIGIGLGIGTFAVQGMLDGLARLAGVPMGVDQIADQVGTDPTILVAAIVINLLLIGPLEELFFRNVLQKRFAERYSDFLSIGLVSLLFAPLHIGNFGGGSSVAIAVSMMGVFLASVLYGLAFAKWGRLEIVAIAHGIQNAIVLVVVYVVL